MIAVATMLSLSPAQQRPRRFSTARHGVQAPAFIVRDS
jgi:hypothetical protein